MQRPHPHPPKPKLSQVEGCDLLPDTLVRRQHSQVTLCRGHRPSGLSYRLLCPVSFPPPEKVLLATPVSACWKDGFFENVSSGRHLERAGHRAQQTAVWPVSLVQCGAASPRWQSGKQDVNVQRRAAPQGGCRLHVGTGPPGRATRLPAKSHLRTFGHGRASCAPCS